MAGPKYHEAGEDQDIAIEVIVWRPADLESAHVRAVIEVDPEVVGGKASLPRQGVCAHEPTLAYSRH